MIPCSKIFNKVCECEQQILFDQLDWQRFQFCNQYVVGYFSSDYWTLTTVAYIDVNLN